MSGWRGPPKFSSKSPWWSVMSGVAGYVCALASSVVLSLVPPTSQAAERERRVDARRQIEGDVAYPLLNGINPCSNVISRSRRPVTAPVRSPWLCLWASATRVLPAWLPAPLPACHALFSQRSGLHDTHRIAFCPNLLRFVHPLRFFIAPTLVPPCWAALPAACVLAPLVLNYSSGKTRHLARAQEHR